MFPLRLNKSLAVQLSNTVDTDISTRSFGALFESERTITLAFFWHGHVWSLRFDWGLNKASFFGNVFALWALSGLAQNMFFAVLPCLGLFQFTFGLNLALQTLLNCGLVSMSAVASCWGLEAGQISCFVLLSLPITSLGRLFLTLIQL